LNKWSERVAIKFLVRTIHVAELLAEFPEMGSVEKKEKNIRGFLISRQTKLFYRVKGSKLIVLTLFDTRQNPAKKWK